jgi:hypothetical protein
MPETNFFWDPHSDNILQERDETGAVAAEYTTEPGLYGNLISQNRHAVESQYHFDALGSTLALTDDTQQVTDTNAYSAFGEVTEHTGSTENPFQYLGQDGYYLNMEPGDLLVRGLTYSARLGRWLCVTQHERNAHYTYLNANPLIAPQPSSHDEGHNHFSDDRGLRASRTFISRSYEYFRGVSTTYGTARADVLPTPHASHQARYVDLATSPVSIPREIKCGEFFGALRVVGGKCIGVVCPKTHPICFERQIGGIPYALCFKCFGDFLCPEPCRCLPTIGRGLVGGVLPGCRCLSPLEDGERGLPI